MNAPAAAPEPRSTPGPSTGTPEPSQAASEAHGGEVDGREPRACPHCGEVCTYDGWGHVHSTGLGIGSCPGGVRALLHEKAGEVARLREALGQVRALHRPDGGTGGPGAMCVHCTSDFGTPAEDQVAWPCATARILASVDAPAPDEAEPSWMDERAHCAAHPDGRVPTCLYCWVAGAHVRTTDEALQAAVVDACWKATPFGQTEDGDVKAYILPKGAVHRLVGAAQRAGLSASLRAFGSTQEAAAPDTTVTTTPKEKP